MFNRKYTYQGLGFNHDYRPLKKGTMEMNSFGLKDWLRASIYTPLMFYQFYLSWRYYNSLRIDWVTNLGWLILSLSAIFGWLPIYELRKHGGVPNGKSYVSTTRVVNTGVYSLVRHPQFLAGILIALSMMLISQHIHSVVAGLIASVVFASEVPVEDRRNIEKFGEPYRVYMKEVPALNFIAGIFRRLK